MEYIVEMPHDWWLRGTTATSERGRASRFMTEADAAFAIERAKKFLPRKSVTKSWRIVQVEPR